MTILELALLPSAVPCARQHAVSVLRDWGLRDRADDAALVTSELVTNAIAASVDLPGRPPVFLRLLADERSVRVEVQDRSPLDPVPGGADTEAERGRGLAVVAALSVRYGSERTEGGGKVVWAELAQPDR